MEKEELLKVIERAARDKATELDLSNKGLTALPPEIAQLKNLQLLNLTNNQLTSLPPEIGQLKNLRRLSLDNNQLTALPPEIAQLQNLQKLFLYNNQLTSLLSEIAQLKNLQELFLFNNQLTVLPPEIGQLQNLQVLYLSDNQLTGLPLEIAQLKNLQVLNLSHNQLTALPPEIAQLKNLKKLFIHNNQLTTLPPEIAQLKNLEELFLENNPLPIPPEILAKWHEPATIINYYLQHQVGVRRPLNEAKMLLVGQGSVGKTSLRKQLIDGSYDPHESKTDGIDIKQWQVTVGSQNIRLNVWDFGGQEIMHATHQFFLTKRSLYLLVLDARLEEEENRLEYWLKIIHSFGGDSPVIIVGNKIDQKSLDLDRRGLQAKYPQIKAFVETSCATGDGIDELKGVITKEVSTLEHIHDELLDTWFAVKDRLEQMEQDYITYPEYTRMCEAEGITDTISQKTLVGFLHDLGIALNFQDDPRLEDTNILNPEWVTNGVYKILNSNALFQEKGVLERNTLNQILDSGEYPKEKHLFIMDMMRKFELCYDFEGTKDKKFLIPDLLSKEESYTGDWDKALAFQYHYNVLPGSIISRFIVRMHPFIHKNTAWRSGVVLKDGGNKALVKADTEDKKIFIWVDGSQHTRRDLLSKIRGQFDSIHETITGIQAEQKVPLPDHSEIVVSYNHLLNLEKLGKTSFVPEGAIEECNVKQLLDGIEPEQKRRKRQEGRFPQEEPEPPTTPPPLLHEKPSVTITPWEFLREAIIAVPAVKYALGVGGIVAVIAIVAGWGIDLRVAAFGAIVMIVLMIALVIFARATTLVGRSLQWPALILTWFVLVLFMAVSTCLFLSVFFEWPVDLGHWLGGGG